MCVCVCARAIDKECHRICVCGYIIYIEGAITRREWRYHRLEVSIESKRGMMCVCVCARARSIKSAIEFVCAHIKDIVASLLERERGQVQFCAGEGHSRTFNAN